MVGSLLGIVLFAVASPEPTPVDTDDVRTMSLTEASSILRERNPDLEAAEAAIDEARAVAHQSLAAVKPVVAVSGSYVRNNTDAVVDMGPLFDRLELGESPGRLVIQPLQNLSANGRADVPLFAAEAYWEIGAARAAVAARTASREALEVRLHGALERAAWLAAAAESFVDVAMRAEANARAHLQTAERLLEAGRTTRLTVDRAALHVLQRQTAVLEADRELDRARWALARLLGLDEPIRITQPVHADTDSEVDAGLDAMVSRALTQRAELTATRADERAAQQRLTAAKLRYAPTLGAMFSASTSTAPFPTGLYYAWQAGVTLRWTVYAGGVRRAARQRAEAGLRQVRASEAALRADIRADVVDAHRDLEVARLRLRLAEREVRVARAASESAARSFAQGTTGSLEVLDAHNEVFAAELRYEEARLRSSAAAADLRAAQGLL